MNRRNFLKHLAASGMLVMVGVPFKMSEVKSVTPNTTTIELSYSRDGQNWIDAPGQIYMVDESGGCQRHGRQLRFPPAHPRCRCVLDAANPLDGGGL